MTPGGRALVDELAEPVLLGALREFRVSMGATDGRWRRAAQLLGAA
ncbi:hypothetical protein ABT187_06510 [Streptomyces sp. NPDC001817]